MFDSLRSRLALSNLLITLLGLVVMVYVFFRLLETNGTDVRKSERAGQAQHVAAQIERLFVLHLDGLQSEIDAASRALGVRIIVYGPNGRFVADSARHTPFFTGSWHPLDAQALKKEASASRQLKSKSLILFQSPLHGSNGQPLGAVLLVTRVTDVQPSLGSLQNVIFLAAGIALVVWLLIGFYFTFSVSRPLLRIRDAAAEMARGHYGARVRVRSHGDIARLATTFNTMAQQVQQTNQVLKDFLGNVSHDLRTPLTMITGFSQALLDGTAKADEVEASAAVIHEEAIKMQRLVDDLLQLTRLESGLLILERHPTELAPFVQSMVDRVARGYDSDKIAVIRNLVPLETPPVDIDPERMERVLANLLNNALQYTPPDGTITIRAQILGSRWVEVSVEDTGAGIPAGDLARIFERFYRSDKSRERLHGHSGLGLAIVKEIVEAHGGRVTVDSQPGAGSTFRFTVPRIEERKAEVEVHASRESVQRAAT